MVSCRICSKLVSTRCRNGAHPTCLAKEARESFESPPVPHGSIDETAAALAALEGLPTFDEICAANVDTQEFIGAGLLPKARMASMECTEKVLRCNRRDAWDHVGSAQDSQSHQKCRLAWVESWMIPK